MTRALLVALIFVLFAGANALVFTGDYSDEDDFLLIALLIGIGFGFGLMVGRPWALALVLTWLPLILLADDGEREISTLWFVLITLGVTVPFQAGGLAFGVALRQRLAKRG